MRFSLTHQGVPIGSVDLALDGGQVEGVVEVLPAYEAVRAIAQRATKALLEVRDRSREARAERREGFREGAELARALELRDAHGDRVPADYVVLHDEPGRDAPLLKVIGVHAVAH